MHIYFSGIGGSGISSLAAIAWDAGYEVSGSDLHESPAAIELERRDIDIVYDQSESTIQAEHLTHPIDWLVYTSALPNDAPELKFARANGIRISKRDEFLAEFIQDKQLDLIAVAGTHGKTTTTAMLVWTLKQLGQPVSYAIGSTIPFGPSGAFDPTSRLFVYEADEYDRNFLHFHPRVAALVSVDYDHADIYPTREAYKQAFRDFLSQSDQTVLYQSAYNYLQPLSDDNLTILDHVATRESIDLPGQTMRDNAWLAMEVLREVLDDFDEEEIAQILSRFPGTSRRFEKLTNLDGHPELVSGSIGDIYSDYAHHPAEIRATIEKAREISDQVVAVYQPHQNLRQTEIQNEGGYGDAFAGAAKVYWTPTYLVRGDLVDGAPREIPPAELIAKLSDPAIAEVAELDDDLWQKIQSARESGASVIIFGAGPIDAWAREQFAKNLS
jgi:UDP-N-acetylmuramate--alanine ligase